MDKETAQNVSVRIITVFNSF